MPHRRLQLIVEGFESDSCHNRYWLIVGLVLLLTTCVPDGKETMYSRSTPFSGMAAPRRRF